MTRTEELRVQTRRSEWFRSSLSNLLTHTVFPTYRMTGSHTVQSCFLWNHTMIFESTKELCDRTGTIFVRPVKTHFYHGASTMYAAAFVTTKLSGCCIELRFLWQVGKARGLPQLASLPPCMFTGTRRVPTSKLKCLFWRVWESLFVATVHTYVEFLHKRALFSTSVPRFSGRTLTMEAGAALPCADITERGTILIPNNASNASEMPVHFSHFWACTVEAHIHAQVRSKFALVIRVFLCLRHFWVIFWQLVHDCFSRFSVENVRASDHDCGRHGGEPAQLLPPHPPRTQPVLCLLLPCCE